MTYYRVKADMDNRKKYEYTSDGKIIFKGNILVGNELYTPAERKKIANADKFFDLVEVKKNKIYWFFGARFACE